MTPWAPVTLSLVYDLRVRALTWAERGVLHYIYLLAGASDDGRTVAVEQRVGEAQVASWERALGRDGAAAVGHLVELGFLESTPAGLTVTKPARQQPTSAPGVMVGTLGGEERPEGAVAWKGKPSESPEAGRVRQDRSLFARRMKQWASVPAGVAWETWLASPEGAAHLAAREDTHPGYGARVTRVTQQGHTPGSHRVTPAGGVTLDALRDAAGSNATLAGATSLESELSALLVKLALTGSEVKAVGAALADTSAWWPAGKIAPPPHASLRDLAGYRTDGAYEWGPLLALVGHVRGQAKVRASEARRPTASTPAKTVTDGDIAEALEVLKQRKAQKSGAAS